MGAIQLGAQVQHHIGGYYIGGKLGFGVLFSQKPFFLHRWMMKFCFGWEWLDD